MSTLEVVGAMGLVRIGENGLGLNGLGVSEGDHNPLRAVRCPIEVFDTALQLVAGDGEKVNPERIGERAVLLTVAPLTYENILRNVLGDQISVWEALAAPPCIAIDQEKGGIEQICYRGGIGEGGWRGLGQRPCRC